MLTILKTLNTKKLAIKVRQNNSDGYVIKTANLNMFVVGRFFNAQIKTFEKEEDCWRFLSSFFEPDRKIFKIINIDEEVKYLTNKNLLDIMTDKKYCIISHMDRTKKMYIKRDFKNNALYSEINPVGSAVFLNDEAEKVLEFIETKKPEFFTNYKIEIL